MDSRRNFVGKVAYGLAGTLAAGPARVWGANDRIRIGIIGAGDRGMELINHIRACPNTEIAGFADVYGRMKWDDVSPTITSGCFNPSKGRFLHPSQNRAISLREASLLQAFPRNYYFSLNGGKEAAALMIGNALPPAFIKKHALAIKASLLAL